MAEEILVGKNDKKYLLFQFQMQVKEALLRVR